MDTGIECPRANSLFRNWFFPTTTMLFIFCVLTFFIVYCQRDHQLPFFPSFLWGSSSLCFECVHRDWESSKSLDDSNSKEMTIFTWTKTIAKQTHSTNVHTMPKTSPSPNNVMIPCCVMFWLVHRVPFRLHSSTVSIFIFFSVSLLFVTRHNDDGLSWAKKSHSHRVLPTVFCVGGLWFSNGCIFESVIIFLPFRLVRVYPWHLHCFDMLRVLNSIIPGKFRHSQFLLRMNDNKYWSACVFYFSHETFFTRSFFIHSRNICLRLLELICIANGYIPKNNIVSINRRTKQSWASQRIFIEYWCW